MTKRYQKVTESTSADTSTDTSIYPKRFGVFQAPFHKFGIHPTVLFERDLQLIQRAEELGFHEAWIGEHHSGGHEPIASPEVFMAAASQRTHTIKLGTGVVSLPYHNPFMVAERHVLLDHLSRGRAIMGFGPGQLASDAHMMAVETAEQREMMREAAEVIVRLMRGETVTAKTSWFELRDARLQVLPYNGAGLETVVASVASPSGPRTAGELGLGMINLASSGPGAFEALRDHWSIVESEAAKSGAEVSRDQWRLAAIMHIAETEEQARRDCEYGFAEIWDYLGQISPLPPSKETSVEGKLNEAIESGMVCIGTPDTAIELIRKLAKQTGGFGVFIMNLADFAAPAAKLRSIELFAEYVIPEFTGHLDALRASHEWVLGAKNEEDTTIWRDQTNAAIAAATAEFQRSRG